MSTVIRPEITRKDPNFVSKHRYYELKHFCLQYHEWEKMLREMNMIPKPGEQDPTGNIAIVREYYKNCIKMVEDCLDEFDDDFRDCLKLGVTEERTYENLRLEHGLYRNRVEYYKAYRKFFHILDSHKKLLL